MKKLIRALRLPFPQAAPALWGQQVFTQRAMGEIGTLTSPWRRRLPIYKVGTLKVTKILFIHINILCQLKLVGYPSQPSHLFWAGRGQASRPKASSSLAANCKPVTLPARWARCSGRLSPALKAFAQRWASSKSSGSQPETQGKVLKVLIYRQVRIPGVGPRCQHFHPDHRLVYVEKPEESTKTT